MNYDKEIENRRIWLNGELVKAKDAKIRVLSPTAQFGANVFEGIRCYWNQEKEQLYAFRLDDHHKRLIQSMRLFGMDHNDRNKMRTAFFEPIIANNYREDIAVRQTVFIDGEGSWFSSEPLGMFIAPIPKKRKDNPIQQGEKICVSSWERISSRCFPPEIKVGANYINSRLAMTEATRNGYDTALFLNREGYVAEGCGSCFFMISKGKLITPRLTDSILESITRDTIIKIATELMQMKVEIRAIGRPELYYCDEAFFCGSAVEVSPISSVDGHLVGNGEPGRITNEIHRRYLEIATGSNTDYSRWLTPVY